MVSALYSARSSCQFMRSRFSLRDGSVAFKPCSCCYTNDVKSRIFARCRSWQTSARTCAAYTGPRKPGSPGARISRIQLSAFSIGAVVRSLAQNTAGKITWLSDKPVWVDQWPLTGDKLLAAWILVQEQLQAGHIPETMSTGILLFLLSSKDQENGIYCKTFEKSLKPCKSWGHCSLACLLPLQYHGIFSCLYLT